MKIVTENKPMENIINKPRTDGKIVLWKDGKSRAFFPIDVKGAMGNGWSMNQESKEEVEPVVVVKEPEKPVVEEKKIETKTFKKKSK